MRSLPEPVHSGTAASVAVKKVSITETAGALSVPHSREAVNIRQSVIKHRDSFLVSGRNSLPTTGYKQQRQLALGVPGSIRDAR